MSGECARALQEYYEELEEGIEPYPVFWSDIQCKGKRFPVQGNRAKLDSTFSKDTNFPTFQRAQSFYIPPNIEVRFHSHQRSDVHSPGTKVLQGEMLIVNTEGDLIFSKLQWEKGKHDV